LNGSLGWERLFSYGEDGRALTCECRPFKNMAKSKFNTVKAMGRARNMVDFMMDADGWWIKRTMDMSQSVSRMGPFSEANKE
jgi:hypothetical protein